MKKLLAPGILVIATILSFSGVAHASGDHHRNRHAENNHPVLSQQEPDSPPSPPSQAPPEQTPPEPAPQPPVAAPEPQPVVEQPAPVEASAATSVDVNTEVKLK